MPCLITEPKQELALAPGLLSIIDAAEKAGWSIKPGGSFAELTKPASGLDKPTAYTINSKWWCRDLGQTGSRSFRVTAPTLIELLGLPSQE